MDNFVKHVGAIKSTGSKIIVVFKQLPEDKKNALVIFTDSLPEKFQTIVQELLMAKEGQAVVDFADFLSRRQMPGSQDNVLLALHNEAKLSRVPVTDVVMCPKPNMSVDLVQLLDNIEKLNPQESSIAELPKTEIVQNPEEVAKGLLRDAEFLQDEVNRKKEQAYTLYPSLRPKTVVKETLVEKVNKPIAKKSKTAVKKPSKTAKV